MPYKVHGKEYAVLSLKASVQYESCNLGDGLHTALCVSLKGKKKYGNVQHIFRKCFLKWKWSCLVASNFLRPRGLYPPGSSIHGILQAKILEWVAISFSRGSSWPRDWTQVSHIVGRRFNLWATGLVILLCAIHTLAPKGGQYLPFLRANNEFQI